MKRLTIVGVALMIALLGAVPAFAGGAGRDFGTHHANHAQEMTGFTGTMNPGVMHTGFAGWVGM